ncbi:MAG TPA: SAM-dependent chlorinase/fluorinase [Verrucomicrobiae bacterium]|nr:SAM-dependent chlorinase/fluorinase [Verrucomicrobiae bacterium]
MRRSPMITLLTDFGARDWFVGTMKGVIAGIAPRAVVVDLSHEVAPGDIRAGAFALAASYSFFPRGTIHLVVVDPGVGSKRKGIAVQTEQFCFVGPDNGVLSWALRREKIKSIHSLENSKFFLKPPSHTFHGRDVFAPVAAHLSHGTPIQRFGPRMSEPVHLPWPPPRRTRMGLEGEVIYVDRFGNALTNIESGELESGGGRGWSVLAGRCLCPVESFYQAVPAGRPVAVIGSSGFLEIAVNGGSAAESFKLRPGTPVRLKRKG